MGRDLIKLQENTTEEDGEHHLGFGKQCETTNNSAIFSLQINQAGKDDPKEQLLILEAMSMLLSQNCFHSLAIISS